MDSRARSRRTAALAASLLLSLASAGGVSATHGGSATPELTVVGQESFDRDGDGYADPGPGSVTDVWAYGNYAYLGSFDDPICTFDKTGVRIVDISDPTDPHQVAFVPSPPATRVNDPKVHHIETATFSGEILVASNEPCSNGFQPRLHSNGLSGNQGQGGISIYDVTNPLKPKVLKQNYLKFPVHNTFTWQAGSKAYMLVVDDVNARDVHILDISKPQSPREIAVTGAPDWPTAVDSIGDGEVFLHDGWVAQNAQGDWIAYLAYWDLGTVLLDVNDPANPIFLGDTDFADPDPVSGEKPAGDSHVIVPNADGTLAIQGDEDFSPSGLDMFEFDGAAYPAVEGTFTVPTYTLSGSSFSGPIVWTGGLGCTPGEIPTAPSPGAVALVQRGVCFFQDKAESVYTQGYAGFVVANDAARGEGLVAMSPRDDGPYPPIPGYFVGFSTGEVMKTAGVGNLGATLNVHGVFDGWGYLRVLDTSDPTNPVEIGHYTTENVMTSPPPAGDHTMHNVIVDGSTAYVSWYADGMRVVDFSDPANPVETAHFVDTTSVDSSGAEIGSNFWGVYFYQHPNGNWYILGSDRNTGLWIFAKP